MNGRNKLASLRRKGKYRFTDNHQEIEFLATITAIFRCALDFTENMTRTPETNYD